MTISEFDKYAASYDCALDNALTVSGEDKTYFAKARIAWLADCLRRLEAQSRTVLDYGCGIGTATPFLFDLIEAASVIGTDISSKSLEMAKNAYGSDRAKFLLFDQYEPCGTVDLAFCNGVFHHIPPDRRDIAANYIYRSLKPGGLFAFWENNPWNPGTRYIMSQCPFDRDAIMLTTHEARCLLRTSGFRILRWDFLFIFPRVLRWLRPIEPFLSRLPMGAQYQILCRKA
jgi:SAM-dependent methyltransferase